MSGNTTPANKAGKSATGAKKTAANANVNAAPAANAPAAETPAADADKAEGDKAPAAVSTGVQAPAKPAMTFKIGKPLPTGKRGGGKRGSKYTSGKLLKFAEAPYGNIGEHLRHVLNGLGMIVFPHTSGFYADHNNVVSESPVAAGTTTYATYADALAARAIQFANAEGDHFIGYAQNNKLPEGAKTSKPDQAYHCFLTAETAEQIEKCVANLQAFQAIPGAELFNVDKNLVFLTDEEGNILAEPLVVPQVAQAAVIAAPKATNAENTEAPAADETAKADAEATADEVTA